MRRYFAQCAAGATLAALAIAWPAAAGAQVQRTFVASSGIDTDPCTLAQPYRSFAAAISLTNAGGEIVVLDSAGYGPASISQSVSIIAAPGVYAGISVFPGNNGVTITTSSPI